MTARVVYLLVVTVVQAAQASPPGQYICYNQNDEESRTAALLGVPSNLHSTPMPAITTDPGMVDQYELDFVGHRDSSYHGAQQCQVNIAVNGDRGGMLYFLTPMQLENRDSLYVRGSDIGKLNFIKIELLDTGGDFLCTWDIRGVQISHLKHHTQLPCRTFVTTSRVRRAAGRHMIVAVKTHSDYWSGNDNGVYVKIHGTKGSTGKIHIIGEGGLYVDGWNTKELTDIGDIGIVTRITMCAQLYRPLLFRQCCSAHVKHTTIPALERFSHDDDQDYQLRYVRVEEKETTGSVFYYFYCSCWFTSEHLSQDIDIKDSNACPAIPHCKSQRCKTCDNCDTQEGSRYCELKADRTGCKKGADIRYCDTGKQTCDECRKCIDSNGTHFFTTSPDQKKCFICTHIENCKTEVCLSDDGQSCTRCNNVISEAAGERGYKATDDRRTCKQACSWLTDSNRCYPGTCSEEYVESCVCSKGFTDHHCQTIEAKPLLLENRVVFDNTSSISEAPLQSWTHLKNIKTVEVDFKSSFIQPGIVPPRPDYVKGYKVGITSGSINFKLYRGGTEDISRRQTLECRDISESSPQESPRCLEKYNLLDLVPSPLMTDDVLQFELVVQNGGYVTVDLHNTWLPRKTYNYNGVSVSATLEMAIDYVVPYHCSETTTLCSAQDMLTVINITQEASVSVSWDGWKDDSSGLKHYLLEVFEMEYIESVSGLRNKRRDSGHEFNTSFSEGNITLREKGVYAVELTAYDVAGNYRTSRRIMIYDEESKVSVTTNELRVTSAAVTSSWEWQWKSDSVTIVWESRYINVLHHELKWLQAAINAAGVDSLYDDHGYARGMNVIPNVQAIVEFRTAFQTDHEGGDTLTVEPDDSSFTSRGQDQSHTISPPLVDGDTLRYWIRAYDIRDEYLEENVTVHIDTSPPIIENLWLTRGERLNVSVHGIEELSTMTIEWESYDEHSGLETVSWRLFDNFTGADILHGLQHITAQGDAADEASCISKYGSYPRGSNCYCTPGVGCYHRHYQVKPIIVEDNLSHGGVFQSKDKGVHDVDYFLEVTVMNHAHLKTTLDFKITVDASPPQPGVVHDGQKGNPEVDYQSSLKLHAHWDGFFDRESGVKFYQYGFADHCLQGSDFALDLSTVQITETFSTHATWTAPKLGKFHITVVAYNRALEPSSPVCSDGVTVDQTGPVLSQIAVLNSRTTEGLVKTTGGQVWLISQDRRRSKVEEPGNICTQKALMVSDSELNLLPLYLLPNGTRLNQTPSVCTSYEGFSLSGVNRFYLNKDQFLYVNWTSNDADSGIYDHQLGLMSNPSRQAAPDIQSYTSTHHHPHYQGFHPAISEGQQFYISVKAINRAGLTTVEVLGPVTIHTQPPSFTGTINVVLQDTILLARWTTTAFSDPESNYLRYQFSIGSSPGGTEALPFRPIQAGGSCSASTPPSCTAININDLPWDLHHSHTYYVSIKVTNIVGLSRVGVSDLYKHDVRIPSFGVVFDVSPQEELRLFDITEFEDSDFQLSTSTLDARWYGFDDGLDGVTYKVCIGTGAELNDVKAYEDVGGNLSHQFQSLNLQVNKNYFVTVVATSDVGDRTISSDGVTIIQNNTSPVGVTVKDGRKCDLVSGCVDDISYQASPSTYSAYWTTSLQQKQHYPDTYIGIERRVQHSDGLWSMIADYKNYGLIQHATLGGLSLEPGHTYRASVKFCAVNVCTKPVYSDGVTVIPHPPVSGGISVTYTETGTISEIDVRLDRYRDPDLPGLFESYDVMDRYEWGLTDNSHSGSLLIHWTPVSNPITYGDQIAFAITLRTHLIFTKCYRVAVRGYNKVGHYTIVSTDVKDCKAFDPLLIVPAIIIDAFGSKTGEKDQGKSITLDKNARWEALDADYTPYKNVLSAVWPSLRHHNYTWAVVSGENVDPVFHYKRENLMTVTDPCTLPNVVKCGKTEKEFINANFDDTEFLQHGKRYYVCIHADEIPVKYEKWPKKYFPEVNECSDGVTVDLTPPSGGIVTVRGLMGGVYQVSKSEVSVSWDDFTDVEESGPTPHSRGISHYQLALGSVPGGEDILAKTDVGLVNHYTISKLTLYDGQTIYASVVATDFVNKSQRVSSAGFVIDSSPPEKTDRQILFEARYATSSIIYICWEGVLHDPESGIKYYDVSFGSRPGQADIVPLTQVEDVCGQFDTDSKLPGGHSFYISVKAFNHAGLSGVTTSHALSVDTTPPNVGHVFDGKITDTVISKKDMNYVTNKEDMGAHWEGFSDPHSPISHFKVKLGSCPGCDDAVQEYESNARTDVVFVDRHILLEEGTKYYVTVTACNKAGLCNSATSDGVILDQSPPVPGRVMDGTQDRDIQYQASRTFLGCKWHGFQDPESGLDYYKWWVGTSPGGQDILSPIHAALEEMAFHILSTSNLLPVGRKIFVTVRAYNKAGLYTESSSNGFLVDNTAPVVVKSPGIEGGQGSLVAMTLMSRTTMRISWEFGDEESFIEKQYISISSHQLGEFDSSLLEIPGLLREFTYTKLDFHDGSRYSVKVTACNMAGMCTTASTGDILVDGSKPLTGTLAIKTDHSAGLSRHQSDGMTWTGASLNLAWLGFADLHSGIDHYIVTVGSSSFRTDLVNNELPSVIVHNIRGVDKDDEGVVQVFTVNTKDISSRSSVFVAIWAVNGAGLKSNPLHSELALGRGGQLELTRRCTPYNCEGHCVCAVKNKKCTLGSGCTVLVRGGNNAIVTVSDVISLISLDPDTTVDVNFSPSDTFLAATWRVTTNQGQQPVRYEFSGGETGYDTPKGIYNEALDRVWYDAGTCQFAIVVLERGKGRVLIPGLRYSVFVRAWYNDNTYSIFKSDGVLIDNSRPTFTDKVGMSVKEHTTDTGGKDVDFQSFTNTMYISWDGKFLPGDSGLLKYRAYVSTSPGGHSIHGSVDITTRSYTATRLSLEADTVYFSSILAYNKAGLVGWTYSDGVQLDIVKPITGIVRDGDDFVDIDYQSSSTTIAASWFGFSDTDSTIVSYFWCVGTTSDTVDCSLLDWQNVGLHTLGRTQINSQSPGTKIWTKVYAVDVAGNESPVAVSDGVVIDTSGPAIKDVVYLGDNLVSNPSFEEDEVTAVTTDVACNHLIPTSWETGTNSCIRVLTPRAPNAKHGNSHLAVSGSIHQNVTGLIQGEIYLLTVHTGYPETLTVNHKAVEGSVSIGREVFTFSLDPHLCKGVCQVKEQSSIMWSTHKYKFVAEASSADLSIATASRNMEVVVDYVTVQTVQNSGDASIMESQQHLILHPMFLLHWSSVHASWYFSDDKSPITEYTWAAGTVPGGTQIQKFVSVGRHSHGTLTGLRLTHNQKMYLTITARNAAGLTTVSHPDPITVDMTPPVFSLIVDGKENDIDYQEAGDVHATWSIKDDESGLHSCDWAIGKTSGGSDIKKFETVPTGATTAKFNITDALTTSSLQVFTTVRCFNLVGHMATATTDGVTVIRVDTPPTVKGLRVLEDQVPYLYGRGNCQSSKNVRLQWTRDELLSTVIEIKDDLTSYQPVVQSQYEFATLSGLRLTDQGNYEMDVFPTHKIGVTGDITPLNFTMHGTPPSVKEFKLITITRNGDVYTFSWEGLFISPWKDLLYAVHAGTAQGGADILKRNLRKATEIQLALKSSTNKKVVYFSVTAVDPCGYTRHFSQKFNFSP